MTDITKKVKVLHFLQRQSDNNTVKPVLQINRIKQITALRDQFWNDILS